MMQILLKFSRKFKRFLKLDFKIKVDFITVFFYTAFYRAFILFIPFNKLRKRMGNYKEESPMEVSKGIYKSAGYISWVVKTVSKYTPWESKCLVQALTAQRMLKKRNITSTLYLGVQKDKNNKMLAHAWLRTGKYYVTGGEIRNKFIIVAKFAVV